MLAGTERSNKVREIDRDKVGLGTERIDQGS